MSRSKVLGASVAAVALVAVLAAAVGAKPSPRAAARASADRLIAAYLVAAPGHASVCSSKTHHGFFDNSRSYLAACASADGAFEVFAITNAGTGANLSLNSSYLQQQLNAACAAGGSLFSAGIKGKVVQVFAGDGTETSLARVLRDSYATAIQGYKGHTAQDLACHR